MQTCRGRVAGHHPPAVEAYYLRFTFYLRFTLLVVAERTVRV